MKIKTKATLILGIMISLFSFAYVRNYIYEKELKKEGELTIGRIENIINLPKWSNIFTSYYINNQYYIYHENDLGTKITKTDIGKFYEIKYLPDSPKIIRVNYSKQITDTTAILKAGFTREEIINIKK